MLFHIEDSQFISPTSLIEAEQRLEQVKRTSWLPWFGTKVTKQEGYNNQVTFKVVKSANQRITIRANVILTALSTIQTQIQISFVPSVMLYLIVFTNSLGILISIAALVIDVKMALIVAAFMAFSVTSNYWVYTYDQQKLLEKIEAVLTGQPTH